MSLIERSVEIKVPSTTAYNQWTQFEDFPHFMDGVLSVTQLDDTHLHWKAEIGGVTREWSAEITEQIPDKRIAWTSTSGPHNSGVVTFHRLSDEQCRVMLQMKYDPADFVEKVGDWLGVMSARIQNDLNRFKQFLETRGSATGGWRGAVASPDEIPSHSH